MRLFGFSGSSRRFRRLLNQYRNKLFRVANSWCGDAMLADDLTKETLTRAIAKQHQLKDAGKLEQWLFRILNNCWREYLRRSHPATDLDDVVLVSAQSPEADWRRQQIIDNVRATIEKLPLGQRQVVTLVDLQNFSYAEVSEVLDIPVGTVMSRLSRARRALKASLLALQSDVYPLQRHLRRVK